MEDLLNDLKAYGLKDLSFVIVNYKDLYSMLSIDELQSRVSFPVYQETDEEEVWSVLNGGKDDMFVYDRCGRLTYHIPYPLSIIHKDQPIVKAALFATYFQSPCGQTCSPNTTFQIDLVEERKTVDLDNEATPDTVVEEESYNVTSNITQDNNDTLVDTEVPDYYYTYGNQSWEDNMIPENENDFLGWNETSNQTNSTQNPADNYTEESSNNSLIHSLLNFFGWGMNITTKPTPTETSNFTDNVNEENVTETPNMAESKEIPHHKHHHHDGKGQTAMKKQAENRNAIRCQGTEDNVCKAWSKRKLLQAQQCCSSILGPSSTLDESEEHSCQNFSRKRCKKIKIVLKCCLKTEIISQKSSGEIAKSLESKESM